MPGPLFALLADPPPEKVTPGVLGFTVMFVLALATVLLVRSMVGHLRKVRYGPGGPDGPPLEEPAQGPPAQGPPAQGPPAQEGSGSSAAGKVERE